MSLSNPKIREQVEILFGEPQGAMRQAIRTALHREGFKRVVDFDRLEGVRDALRRSIPDVLVLDARMQGDGRETTQLLRQLRFNQLGRNPFLNVIVTMWDPNQALVRSIVDSGCDDLLAKPLSPGLIIDRINTLATSRKPFVVTSDYIGPDRRKDAARGSDVPQITVPNTLQAKADGKPLGQAELASMIAEAQARVNDEKLKRNAFQICFVVGLALPSLRSAVPLPETASQLSRIIDVTRDIQARMEGTDYGHVSELCGSLLQVTGSLLAALEAPSRKDVDLLEPLAHAVLAGFNPQSDARQMANQINSAVAKFEARKAEAQAAEPAPAPAAVSDKTVGAGQG